MTIRMTAAARALAAAAMAAALLLVSGSWSAAHAISNGTTAPDTALDRATVMIGASQCSGTLVAADLVLTAGHCLPARPAPPHPPFRSSFEPERPDRFYSFGSGGGVTVNVGTRRGAPRFSTTANEYALPGLTDIALLRLQQPVPATDAIPVPIMTALGASDPAAWLRGKTFQVAGFGQDATGAPAATLQQGLANGAVFPCPFNQGGWTFGAAYKVCVQSADGSGTRPGDSGGPLYWNDGSGRSLLGVYQGMEGVNGGRYHATFYRGGSNYDRLPYPNLGDWLQRMAYGRAGGTAFLWASDGTRDHYASRSYASNPSGLQAHVDRLRTGVYRAVFEGLRHAERREPRVALVTAYGTGSTYCKLRDASAADRIEVGCFDAAGLPADAEFSLLSDISDRDLVIRVPRVPAGSTTVPGLSGGATITRLGTGSYLVDAPDWGGGAWENVLVTRRGTAPPAAIPRTGRRARPACAA